MKSAGSMQRTGPLSFKLTVCAGTDDSGKRIRKTKTVQVTGKSDEAQIRKAKHQLALFVADVERGRVTSSGNMTLREYFAYWKENYAIQNLEQTTLAAYDYIYKRIDQALGHKKIADIEPKHLLAFMKNLSEDGVKKDPNATRRKRPKEQQSKKLSSNSIRKHYAVISSILSQAVKWNMIPYNPCERVATPKLSQKAHRIYNEVTLTTFLKLLETENTKHRLMVLLTLTGGIRREELFGLCWQDVNFNISTITVRQASVYVSGEIITKAPKNASSARNISLPPSTIALLNEHQKEQSHEQQKFGDKWISSGRIFTKWNGEPAHPHSFGTWLKRFTKKHNLPHISPHALRHMNATYLIVGGVDIRTVAGKLGHSQTSTTVNIYAQFMKEAEKETANTMEALLKRLQADPDNKEEAGS